MLKLLADENFNNIVVRGLVGQVIEDIITIIECSYDQELEGQIQYLPL